jgi:hypothetical protein
MAFAPTPTWSRVVGEARSFMIAADGTVDESLIVNLEDLALFGSGLAPEPVVSLGVRPAIVLSWPGLTLEVFPDRIEVYRLSEPNSAPDFWFEPHLPGMAFSEDFERVLPKLPDWLRRRDRP